MKKYFRFAFSFLVCLCILINLNVKIIRADTNIETASEVDRLEKIKEKGVLTVLSSDMPPYSYKDPRFGRFVGIDADIVREIAKRLGAKEVKVKYVLFSNMLEELAKNPEIDLVAQGIYITDERKNLVNFVSPIYKETEVILTRKDSNINSMNDLKNKIIGIIEGTVYVQMAENWKKEGLIKDYIKFSDNNSLLIALDNKTIDATITYSIIGKNILLEKPNSNLKVLSPSQYKAELNYSIGYPLKKEDTNLLNRINEIIVEMKNDGTIYEVLTKYGAASNYIP